MSGETLLDFNRDELTAFLAERGEPQYRAKQIWQAIYRDLVPSYEAITPLPKGLRVSLAEALPMESLHPIDSITSRDKRTHKDLFRLADGETIEAVLMLYEHRRTVCLSTQVGCAIGCPFCATGRSGFTRDLTVGEIVAQALHFARELHKKGERLTNIVYMGMGEPFLNYEATMKSVRILNDPNGFALGARHLTVSTVGIIPEIERFTHEDLQVNLA
ncbi:23S rRNA (adenine(2503)-C(2))-methyltransferase RlmN, partial [Candidatus Bipolaricaulota bacterium]|nr:23S rRNA (adenine(2503)-C(2))-methyltransferase RlmN [Candidatus Bipolaricaulota bacterium]